jgi:hypothetical protein
MKNLSILLMAFSVAFISCDTTDDIVDVQLSENDIPGSIKQYVETHFSPNTIIRVVKDFEFNTFTYEVYLGQNIELEFNEGLKIISIESISKLPNSVIPQAILDYVAQIYPNSFITDWELEQNHQQVELNTNQDLEFNMDGTFIRIDPN